MSLSLAQRKVLQDFIQAGSGLADKLVLWGRPKGGGLPDTEMFISLRTEGLREISPGVTTIAPAPSPAPGADLRFRQEVDMRTTLVVECFPGPEGWQVEVPPDRVLARVIQRRSLPLAGVNLRAAGIGFGPIGDIEIVTLDRTSTRDDRAVVRIEVNFAMADVTELGTSIERVEMESTVNESTPETTIIDAPVDP